MKLNGWMIKKLGENHEKETIKMYSLWNWKNQYKIGRKDFIV